MLALTVDGTAVHDLGATDSQELGYTLAVGAASTGGEHTETDQVAAAQVGPAVQETSPG